MMRMFTQKPSLVYFLRSSGSVYAFFVEVSPHSGGYGDHRGELVGIFRSDRVADAPAEIKQSGIFAGGSPARMPRLTAQYPYASPNRGPNRLRRARLVPGRTDSPMTSLFFRASVDSHCSSNTLSPQFSPLNGEDFIYGRVQVVEAGLYDFGGSVVHIVPVVTHHVGTGVQ